LLSLFQEGFAFLQRLCPFVYKFFQVVSVIAKFYRHFIEGVCQFAKLHAEGFRDLFAKMLFVCNDIISLVSYYIKRCNQKASVKPVLDRKQTCKHNKQYCGELY